MSKMNPPYIPKGHKKYDLLPLRRKNGGEVFSYPAELSVIDDMLSEHEEDGMDEDGQRVSLLTPYGVESYEEYFGKLESYAEKYRESEPELADALLMLRDVVKAMNIKEQWSVVRYTGADLGPELSLTPGRCYYWPCSIEHPEYEGVIDDEEFTSYLYPCDADCWEILEDPTGMAARALSGDADTVHGWTIELFEGTEDEFTRMLREAGAKVKQERKNYVMSFDEISWSSTDVDSINITCPGCRKSFDFGAWTLVNAKENPEAVPKIIDGSIYEFTCPYCGYEAHLAHPCLFVDPDRKVCIYSVIDDDMAAQAQEMFSDPDNEAAAASTCRITRDRFELAEKVLIFTSGLDDRPIELLKFGIRGSLKMQGFASVDDEVDVKLVGFDGRDTLSFSITCDENSFSSDIELGAVELFANALSKSSIANKQSLFVDKEWGERALDVIEAEGTMD